MKTERRKKFCSFSLVWLMHSCSRLFTCGRDSPEDLEAEDYISLYLPVSPCISLYLPVSPCISLYLTSKISKPKTSSRPIPMLASRSLSLSLPPPSVPPAAAPPPPPPAPAGPATESEALTLRTSRSNTRW